MKVRGRNGFDYEVVGSIKDGDRTFYIVRDDKGKLLDKLQESTSFTHISTISDLKANQKFYRHDNDELLVKLDLHPDLTIIFRKNAQKYVFASVKSGQVYANSEDFEVTLVND
jgi:uncharacterized protein (UPF0128 family)